MKYDTTMPGSRNEWWSLLVMAGVLVVAAGGIWLTIFLMWVTGVGSGRAAVGAERAHATGFVNRMSETYALVRGGNTYVNIYARGNEMSVRRAAPPNLPEVGENWNLARMVQRVVNNPGVAKAYEMTAVVPQLKELNLQVPALSPAQQSMLGELFLQSQDTADDARRAADQALIDAVAGVPINPADQAAFDAAMEKVKTILTPEQIEWIRNGRRPTTTSQPAK